jgi:hypothetical protein
MQDHVSSNLQTILEGLNFKSAIAGLAVSAPVINTYKEVNDVALVPLLSILGIVYLALQIYFIIKNKGRK